MEIGLYYYKVNQIKYIENIINCICIENYF